MPTPHPLTRHDLYTLCVQSPERDARALRSLHALHAGAGREKPLILAEDFCGPASISLAWTRLYPGSSALAVDRDPKPLAHAKTHAKALGGSPPNLRFVCADVHTEKSKAHVLAALNFAICELHERAALVKYLKHARTRLKPRGCAVFDLYGGVDAFSPGMVSQRFKGPDGEKVMYVWEQRDADPLRGRVCNALHFRVTPKRGKSYELHDAFVYHWRLWSVPELVDAMLDAGFSAAQVFPRQAGAIDQDGELYFSPVTPGDPIDDSYNVFVVGRR